MKVSVLIGTIHGSKTKITADYILNVLKEKHPENNINLIDLGDYQVEFSDGRNYLDYSGDTGKLVRQLMDSDVLIIITPIYQASIPGSLKNVFDLLPLQALQDKIVSMVAVAGSEKHYLAIEQQLKPILAFMKAQVVQTYVYMLGTDFVNQKIANDELIFRLDRLVEETLTKAKVHKEIQAENDAKYDF